MLRLAGIDLSDDCVLQLVTRLRSADLDNQADRIVEALMSQQTEVTLTPPDRVAILTVLDGGAEGLAELRGVLLAEHTEGQRDGLV